MLWTNDGCRRTGLPTAVVRRHRRGFTLIELLIVITVIALLLAIFAPSFQKVKIYAIRLMCQANLHEMGNAMAGYVGDNKVFPGHADSKAGSGVVAVWPSRLRLHMGGSNEAFWCPAQEEGFQWQSVYNSGRSAGPVHVKEWGYKPGEMMLGVHSVPFSYGYNDWGAHGAFWDSGLGGDLWVAGNRWGPRPWSVVQSPGNMIAIADNTCDGSWDYNIDPTNPWEYPGKIHEEGANFLFVDVHVEWILQEDAVNVGSSPEGRAMNARWNSSNRPE
ncbi:MAG: type II secretion system protein [Phycisphaerae bacterium]|nr:type II secretion system protein [Phycisphaerae bacterium]